MRAYVDGVLLDERQVTVTTLGKEFHPGLEGEYVLEAFPYPGESATIEWQRGQQNFVITDREE